MHQRTLLQLSSLLIFGALASGCHEATAPADGATPPDMSDAGVVPMDDASVGDAGSGDAGIPLADAGDSDAGPSDAGPSDSGPSDSGPSDAGAPDGGPSDGGTEGCVCPTGTCDGALCVVDGERLEPEGVDGEADYGNWVALDGPRAAAGSTAGATLFGLGISGWARDERLPNTGNDLGRGVAVDGTLLAVSATEEANPSGSRGAVHLFELSGETAVPGAIVRAPSGSTRFGQALALHGDVLVVRTTVRQVEICTGRPTFDTCQSVAADGATGTFGARVAASDDYVAVGDLSCGDDGCVIVYAQDGDGTWVEHSRVTPPSDGRCGVFGGALALDGARLYATLSWSFASCSAPEQVVYAYDLTAGGVGLAQTLEDPAGPDPGLFGYALAAADGRLLASDSQRRRAYLFAPDASGALAAVARVEPTTVTEDSHFGLALAFDGSRALVGAPDEGFVDGPDAGEVWAFDFTGL